MVEETNEGRAAHRKKDPASIQHRHHLVTCEHKSQEEFDKTLIALSGGALAISFAFVENFIKQPKAAEPEVLFAAWICWAASLVAVFLSFLFSVWALREAVAEFDRGENNQRPGGNYAIVVGAANAIGACLFLAGLLIIFRFVYVNL